MNSMIWSYLNGSFALKGSLRGVANADLNRFGSLFSSGRSSNESAPRGRGGRCGRVGCTVGVLPFRLRPPVGCILAAEASAMMVSAIDAMVKLFYCSCLVLEPNTHALTSTWFPNGKGCTWLHWESGL